MVALAAFAGFVVVQGMITPGDDLGLFRFGLHLALLGYLSLRSDFIPKVVGAPLVVAGAG